MPRLGRLFPAVLFFTFLAGALFCLQQIPAKASPSRSASAQDFQDNAATNAATERLNKSQFKDVRASVSNGIATLTGSVSLYEFKRDAARRVLHTKGVQAVRNLIEVAGPAISDSALQAKLDEELTYDRVGFGHVFNAFSVVVRNGVVTVGGHARTYVDRDSALALVYTTSGVRDVIDEIEVDPVSPMDDQIRLQVARAIYGYPTLNKYAINPARPIRISVQNGNVELYGIVDSRADRQTAFLRANGVPGVFSVKNYLQVANQPSESPN